MKILNYIISTEHQENRFIKSLFAQFTDKGHLSPKQEKALRKTIDIEEDFFEYDFKIREGSAYYIDFMEMKAKFSRDRFRYTRTKNECIQAMQSIIYNMPLLDLIDKVLGRNKDYWRR